MPTTLIDHAKIVYDEALELGKKHGYRNAQVTVLAPTGTIAFMMDCDTTGVEPDIALIKYKKLVGEGLLKIVNQTVPAALKKLGYTADQTSEILDYLTERETIEGAPHIKAEHLSVFDCAFKPANGTRSIHYMGHVRMMGAIQPFISGAISKTVNMPEAATAEEIEQVYLEGWKLGLKAIAIYRDNSKRSQPLSTSKTNGDVVDTAVVTDLKKQLAKAQAEAALPHRRRLPSERTAVTHKFEISGHEGYITVGLYPDGQPGEIFLKMAKEGSTVSGLMDSFATTVSVALQYGVPLKDLVNKFAHVRFEPSGFTGNQEIPIAKSIVDYIFRWLGSRFLDTDDKASLGLIDRSQVEVSGQDSTPQGTTAFGAQRLAAPSPDPVARPVAPSNETPSTLAAAPGIGSDGEGAHTETSEAASPPTASEAQSGDSDVAQGDGRRASPADAAPGDALKVIATNGHAANGGSQDGQRERWRHVGHHAEPGRHEGELPDPGRRPELRRLRLDHGPQRQLLQVPQLRLHERLQLGSACLPSIDILRSFATLRTTSGAVGIGLAGPRRNLEPIRRRHTRRRSGL